MKAITLHLVVAVCTAGCGVFVDGPWDENGTDGCAGKGGIGQPCDVECPCNEGTCVDGVCEQTGDCCPDQAVHIWVRGMALDLSAQAGVAADLAVLASTQALTGFIDQHEAETTSGADGSFEFGCFDVADVAVGLIVLVDDAGYDGAAGDFFPTITGIAGWSEPEDKVCVEAATAMVINNTLQAGLDQIPGLDKENSGYVIGTVLDAERNPIEGATVERSDGEDLTVIYPAADFSNFDGQVTSASGIYIITDLSFSALIGVKGGFTWDPELYKAATIPGAAYYVPLVANGGQ